MGRREGGRVGGKEGGREGGREREREMCVEGEQDRVVNGTILV